MSPATEFFDYIKRGDADGVRRLLDADPALVEIRTEAGVTPLLLALYHGQDAVAEALREVAPTLTVHEAAALGDVARLSELLRDRPALANDFSPDGYHPLGLAAFFGRLEAARLLIAAGAEVDAASRNPMQVMALHSAVASRQPDAKLALARLLLEHGANVNVRQQEGWTPLHQAASAGDLEMVRLFLGHGAVPDAVSTGGKTPYDLAVERGHGEVAALLTGTVNGGSVADRS